MIGAIAQAAHEVNRAYCAALGDDSQPAWADAPDWQRDSALNGVALHLGNPSAGPEQSHVAWMAQKVAEGWQWGPIKDPAAKRHPCIVAFDALPREQQAKDYIFRAVVHAVAEATAAVERERDYYDERHDAMRRALADLVEAVHKGAGIEAAVIAAEKVMAGKS